MSTPKLSTMADRAVAEPISFVLEKIMAAHAAGKDVISLAAGLPDIAMLPTELIGPLYAEASALYPGLLNYTRPQGFPPFTEALAGMLDAQGVQTSASEVLITSGGMEGISIAAQLTLNAGDTALVESPAFPGAVSTFKLVGASVVHVICDENGIIPEALQAAIQAHSPKLVSLMPDNQNPSGMVLSLERRKAVARILQEHGVWAVEDGAYSQLTFDGEQLPPLQPFAPDKVFYATSVSKIFAPAMRLGALVLPSALALQKAGGIKFTYNMQASPMNQALAARFLSPDNTHLAKNLAKLRETYGRRCSLMVAALQKHLPESEGYSWVQPKGGMFIWLTGPKTVNFTELLDTAIANGVGYVPGSMFYADPAQGHHAARLNFASTPEDNIEEAISRLAKTVQQAAA